MNLIDTKKMPQELCEFRNCQRVGSSTWSGYCSEAHLARGMKDPEEREKISQRNFDDMMEILAMIKKKEAEEKEKEKEKTKDKETQTD